MKCDWYLLKTYRVRCRVACDWLHSEGAQAAAPQPAAWQWRRPSLPPSSCTHLAGGRAPPTRHTMRHSERFFLQVLAPASRPRQCDNPTPLLSCITAMEWSLDPTPWTLDPISQTRAHTEPLQQQWRKGGAYHVVQQLQRGRELSAVEHAHAGNEHSVARVHPVQRLQARQAWVKP